MNKKEPKTVKNPLIPLVAVSVSEIEEKIPAKKRNTQGTLFLSVFVISLFFSLNHIIHLLLGSPFRIVDISDYQSTAVPYFHMSMTSNPSIFRNVTSNEHVYGFCDTEFSNSDKYFEIIFHSEHRTYAYRCNPVVKDPSEVLYLTGHTPTSDYNSLEFTLPMYFLKDDTYEVYLYVYENEHDFGIVNTNVVYSHTNINHMTEDH